jgi:hypothetical protein
MPTLMNVNAWKDKIESAKKKVHSTATEYVQKKAYTVAAEAIRISPQFTGTFAMNWVLVNKDNPARFQPHRDESMRFRMASGTLRPRQQGDMSGMQATLAYNKEISERLRWNSKVTLENVTSADEGGLLVSQMETANSYFRPANKVAREVGVTTYLKQKFRFIT